MVLGEKRYFLLLGFILCGMITKTLQSSKNIYRIEPIYSYSYTFIAIIVYHTHTHQDALHLLGDLHSLMDHVKCMSTHAESLTNVMF